MLDRKGKFAGLCGADDSYCYIAQKELYFAEV